jgi:UDP-N-acetylmuramate: L-alanyl-gamma-D-glutamyl-meso-diaminopimelate ligase
MHVHFISIGGAVMHNMALALHHKGYKVSGSDDEIYEPAKSRLEKAGILPDKFGWYPEKIEQKPDIVILGMHARKDNPELQKALDLGLKVYSFPAYVYECTRNKKRIVVGGSHGKTTTTAMILHVLKATGKKFDYLVGSILEGFDAMVGLDEESEVAIIEGDEYLSSAVDLRPKFHLYHADIGIITGIAWDHINVFPTYDNYKEQFAIFMRMLPKDGKLIYCTSDKDLEHLVSNTHIEASLVPYDIPIYEIRNAITHVKIGDQTYELALVGKHNMQNMMAAMHACLSIGVSQTDFMQAMCTFSGTAKRLEVLQQKQTSVVYRDFAHAPSKLRATIDAVKTQFLQRKLIAVYELHTYSSLNKDFLPQYFQSMQQADIAFVLFSEHALTMKKLPMLSIQDVEKGFGIGVKVFTNKEALRKAIAETYTGNENLLLMSSGNFDGMDLSF